MPQAEGRSPLQMPHPFYRAFRGGEYKDILKAVQECKRYNDNGQIYIEQLSMCTAALPYHWEQYPEDMVKFLKQEIVEIGIKRLFEREKLINWSTGVHTLFPIVTTGDGNCLLHAVALYMWGIEDTNLVLRKCLYDTLNHGSFAAENMKRWQAERTTTDNAAMSFEFRYNTGEWGREYEMVKQMATSEESRSPANLPYQSLEEFHIFVLANVLRRPILVMSQDKMRSVQGASLQSHPVSGLYLPLNWHPSLCCKFPIVLGYEQSHFFPLLHTAPENEEEEADLMVPIVKSDSEPIMVHFVLPREDPIELMKSYLHCESFIHCPDNRATAVPLPGAKVSCDSLGKTLSVWEAYFSEAEINVRIYYEKEYNPQQAGQEQDLGGYEEGVGVGNIDHEYFGSNKYPGRDNPIPQARGPGQCQTPGCPYQQSVSTGDLCVECFNKGQRVNCMSPDCLNKADVGLEGLCKVCHDGSKFQKSNKIQQKITPIPNINNGSSSEEEDRFKTRPDDLNSLAVDTVKTGTDKCIVPECELTGNPKTGDMCSNCYSENVTLLQQYEETSSRQKERRHQDADEAFVIVNNQGEEEHLLKERQASGGRVNTQIYDRHAELLRKLDMDRDRGAVKSAAVGGNVYSQGSGRDNVNSAPNRQGNMPKITVKKDLCATPGCSGVRLTKSDLCRTCKEEKRAPRDAVRSAAVPPTSPRQHGGEQQRYHSAYDRVPQRMCNIRICNNAAVSPDFRFCKQCLEDMSPANVAVHQGGTASAPRRNIITPVEEQGYPGQAVDTQRHVYGVRTSPNYQEQYEATKKRSIAPSYNSGGRGQRNGRDDHRFGGNIRSAPSSATVPLRTQKRDVDYSTEDLNRQIREEFVPDRSDSTPVPRDVLPPEYRPRIDCQRPGGCPDKMFGDPKKNDLCSKCYKEMSNFGHQGSKPRSVSSGSYDREEDLPYLHQYQKERTPPRSTPTGQRMVDDLPRQVQQTRDHGNIYRRGQVGREIPPEVADHTYQEIAETCAQPGCRRPPGDNVEKFCEQCHANYTALFSDYRQINTAGLHGN